MRKPVMPVLLVLASLCTPVVRAQEASLSDVFQRVSDSVVIVVVKEHEMSGRAGEVVSTGGLGSGVVISADGKILTAAHVVQAADEVGVQFRDGGKAKARILASAQAADVALIQITDPLPGQPTVAPIGDSEAVRVGDQVFVVGAPFGIGHTLTVGHVSARRSPRMVEGLLGQTELFQTDAAINQGNSGGPMFNMKGEVIGIVSHIISRTGGFEGLGFAVTSQTAKTLLIDRAGFWTGIDGFLLEGDFAKVFNLPQGVGLLVQRVAKDSPAEKAGLRPGRYRAVIEDEEILLGGDVILGAMGIAISEEKAYDKIYTLLSGLKPGEAATVTVLRDGERKTLSVPLR
jgi:S1-C subfamily serine protease